MKSPHFLQSTTHPGYKKQRVPGDPIAQPAGNPRFIPIPSIFKRPADLTMDLSNVLDAAPYNTIAGTKKMIFHAVGDTGPIKGDAAFKPVADAMIAEADESHFLYHVGDVVYFNGVSTDYEQQFYEYLDGYPGKIVAIPGNHDCSTVVSKGDAPDHEPSLYGFMENFCSPDQVYHEHSSHRKNMNQPWVYWTLTTPVATIIGLFSNYDGMLDEGNNTTQYDWFVKQLKAAPIDKKLIVNVHHPCFSLDTAEGGYPIILNDFDHAFLEAARYPDLVLSGHVHNYQRFTRTLTTNSGEKKMPYVIIGGGGYAETPETMHKLLDNPVTKTAYPQKSSTTIDPSLLANRSPIASFGLSLDCYNEVQPGFLRITIDENASLAEYIAVPFSDQPGKPALYDSFSF